ncbi:hypothetical protein AVKW3434_19995 [Acidovorax sp. SUPP3434]|uniref:hypothetical protein n=1 Tax=Acidovorax sp. SUPP3434 TaxID=2920880 RepID=UPI0023DE5F12|nr:hypothetical protein [Acidovorax sp. SUPP3434]GKT01710.1 hypothetical protein AVKW3434_19995 [Acidovorax sp. SUPP3434]
MTQDIQSSVRRSAATQDTEAYYQQLLGRIAENPGVLIPADADTQALMPFNGYYPLANAVGAFFAVDTNMVVHPQAAAPFFDLTLIVSLDGKTATRYAFTGTFDGTTLSQTWETGGLSIQLTFTRPQGGFGPVASCSGTIALPGQAAVPVVGSTYNNPIPASLFAGDYFDEDSGSKVAHIGADNQLQYDGGTNTGTLAPVTTYLYNLNMYFFTFMQGSAKVNLIMGTAAEQGFACNNMISGTGGSLVSRSLVTIPKAQKPALELYDLSSCQLADFSGYYTIQGTAAQPLQPTAFVSIQSQYATVLPDTGWDLNFVMISVSLDGVTSQGYYFNPFTMSFKGGTLSMPDQGITLELTRGYSAGNGALASLSGTIGGQAITGSTLFNPVPLSAFQGAPMTNSQSDTLTVNNDNEVHYNGTDMDSIIYVPLMYILAYPASNPTVVMSFGTDGTHGNACIVTTQANTADRKTTSVWGIPS